MKHDLINTFSIDGLIEKIDECHDKKFTPTLAFIYVSVEYDIKYLVTSLEKYNFIIVGATTVGEIYADNILGVNTEDKSITCMLTNLDKSAFKIKTKEVKNDSYFRTGKKVGKWLLKSFANPALLTLTSGLSFNNESYINGLQKKIKFFFGAVAGDDRLLTGPYVFSNKKIISNGVLALAIDRDRIEILTSRAFGWSGIGTQRIVTKSHENLVYTIDDKPALQFYQDYLHITAKDMPDMGGDYPLEVLLKNGQIVYRAALQINEDGSLVFAGHVEEGSKVRISAPVGEEVINYVKKSIDDSLISRKNFKADLTLLFPCASHKNLLGSFAIKEIEAVYAQTKEVPLVGFYAYGEIVSSKESNAFHNQTFVTIQLREKK